MTRSPEHPTELSGTLFLGRRRGPQRDFGLYGLFGWEFYFCRNLIEDSNSTKRGADSKGACLSRYSISTKAVPKCIISTGNVFLFQEGSFEPYSTGKTYPVFFLRALPRKVKPRKDPLTTAHLCTFAFRLHSTPRSGVSSLRGCADNTNGVQSKLRQMSPNQSKPKFIFFRS